MGPDDSFSDSLLDGVARYNTSLDGLIRHRAVFGALGACYTGPCGLTRLRPSKDGSSPYSTLFGRFLQLPAAEHAISRMSPYRAIQNESIPCQAGGGDGRLAFALP